MQPFVLFLAILLLTAADEPKDAAKKDLAKLQGIWTPTSMVFNGKDHSVEGKGAFKMVFKGDIASVEGSDEIKREYAKVRFTLQPGFKPKLVDLEIVGGSQEKAKMEGVYEITGDEFRICVKVFGNDRPTEFASAEGSSVVLVVLKREKP